MSKMSLLDFGRRIAVKIEPPGHGEDRLSADQFGKNLVQPAGGNLGADGNRGLADGQRLRPMHTVFDEAAFVEDRKGPLFEVLAHPQGGSP